MAMLQTRIVGTRHVEEERLRPWWSYADVSSYKYNKQWVNNITIVSPFTFVTDDKFEYAVPVRRTECNRIFSWNTTYRRECSSDVGVKHCKLELKVFQARKRFPYACPWIEFWDVGAVYLKLEQVLAWGTEK